MKGVFAEEVSKAADLAKKAMAPSLAAAKAGFADPETASAAGKDMVDRVYRKALETATATVHQAVLDVFSAANGSTIEAADAEEATSTPTVAPWKTGKAGRG